MPLKNTILEPQLAEIMQNQTMIIEEIRAIHDLLQSNNRFDDYVSLHEAETITKMEKQKLTQMFNAGELVGTRFGVKIRILRSSLFQLRNIVS
jgi:hypothetical protein